MNDDSIDDLVALYRKAAQEAPQPGIDARILRIAESASGAHRQKRRLSWLAGAIAAGTLLWLAGHHTASRKSPRAPMAVNNATPGYLDGRTRAYLLHMDTSPPLSPSTRYLLTQSALSD